ncbi:MAG: hypothetical protein K9J37_02755 [Saprospiraceae bacterium]|nr:hypothetical protein [Saprospiraceae bacterium]MCF8248801.1 hypothetical protein [Saprospiraceae bacterium]MCF8279908.1 hypothetical protein [Bacteroidales bacterium]MCF8310086.1 hypothetical protein [Saprospiraceae bacterium]MCF8438986.1 hypothetical protein [Saprospiraceae bacterium]
MSTAASALTHTMTAQVVFDHAKSGAQWGECCGENRDVDDLLRNDKSGAQRDGNQDPHQGENYHNNLTIKQFSNLTITPSPSPPTSSFADHFPSGGGSNSCHLPSHRCQI